MRFPFVTRSHHEEVVCLLKSQITGLAKLLYPEGVPEEFQLLLGIEIPVSPQLKLQAEPEPEPAAIIEEVEQEETHPNRAKEEEIRRLRSVARTNPSRLGRELERAMARDAMQRANSAHPSHAIFRQARAEVTNS